LAKKLRQLIERIEQLLQVPVGEVDISSGLFQVVMAEQLLNGAEVGSRIIQVCGEAVPQSIVAMPMIFMWRLSAIAITLCME